MSKKTLYLIGISVVIAFYIVMIINVYDMNKLPDPKPGATAAPKAEAVTAAMVADMIEGVLRNNFLYDYKTKLDEEQGLFNVDIWSSDITAESIQRTKDSGNFSVWDNMVSDIASTTATMQKYTTLKEEDVNQQTFHIILQHLEDMARENEEMEKIRKKNKSRKK